MQFMLNGMPHIQVDSVTSKCSHVTSFCHFYNGMEEFLFFLLLLECCQVSSLVSAFESSVYSGSKCSSF